MDSEMTRRLRVRGRGWKKIPLSPRGQSPPPSSAHQTCSPLPPPPQQLKNTTTKKQADPEIHSKLSELGKAFFLAERSLPALPIRLKEEKEEGKHGKEEGEVKKEEEKEGEKEEKTLRFIGPGACVSCLVCVCVCVRARH
jgi:hypothetical protein